MNKEQLIEELHQIQAIKFGTFTLKSGIISPIYLDLRLIISYPHLLKMIAKALWERMHSLSYDVICGVPYTALPIATALSLTHDIPMIMRRKEAKDYGTKKIIEGVFQKGQTCLILEDVITSGASILETLEPLKQEGLKVKDILVVINREQGGKERLENKGLHVHALLTLSEIAQTLYESQQIDKEMLNKVKTFLEIPA